MALDTFGGNGTERRLQLPGQIRQSLILGVAERQIISALQLDAQGKIVTGFPAFETRNTGMPGAFFKRNILPDPAVSAAALAYAAAEAAESDELLEEIELDLPGDEPAPTSSLALDTDVSESTFSG